MKAVLLCLVCTLAMGARADAQQKLNRRFWVAPEGFVRIFNIAGSVEVIGWDKDTLVVTGTVNEPPDGEIVVSQGKQGAKISISGPQESAAKPSHITVYVPRTAQLWVKTQSASVKVSEFTGGLDLFSVTGDIVVSDRPRELYAESMAGSVSMTVATRSVRVKTASGQVSLRGRVDDATVSTVSGPIDLADLKLTRARIESVEGLIRYRGALTDPANLEFVNHAGTIEFALAPTSQAQFSINTFEGTFEDQLGVTSKQWPGKMKGKEIGFIVGSDPLVEVSVRSFKGKVVVRRM